MPPPNPNPDLSIPTSATGPALLLTNNHTSSAPLTLYGSWFCPFVQRVWLVLEELQLSYRYVEINPYAKEPGFLALNPRGLVPALGVRGEMGDGEEGGKERVVYESLVCCEFLNDVYGTSISGDSSGGGEADQEGKKSNSVLLLPHDALARAHARIWIDFASTRIVPAFYRLLQYSPRSTYSLAEARTAYLNHLKTWIRAADSTGPYFLGERFSLVDVVLAPWLVRGWIVNHFKEGGLGVPEEGGEDGDDVVWKRWRVWARAVEGRESVKSTLSEREMYIKAYQRYADDTAQSEVAKATREGGKLP